MRESDDRPVVALMEGVWRQMKSQLNAIAHDLAPELRPSHVRLMTLTPAEGMRIGDLASRARMTAQSLGEFLDTLSRTGYVEITASETDRRVKLVRPTPRGIELGAAMDRAARALEARSRRRVGAREWEMFRDVLTNLETTLAAVQNSSSAARPHGPVD